MASKCMAIDLKADNIVTIAVHPGYVATDMNMHKGMLWPVEIVKKNNFTNQVW